MTTGCQHEHRTGKRVDGFFLCWVGYAYLGHWNVRQGSRRHRINALKQGMMQRPLSRRARPL